MTTQVEEFKGFDYQLPQFGELLALVQGKAGDGEATPVNLLRWRGVAPGHTPPPRVGWKPAGLYGPGIVGCLYHLLLQSYDRDVLPALRAFKVGVGVEFEVTVAPSLRVVFSSSVAIQRLFAASWRPGANGDSRTRPAPPPKLLGAMHFQIAPDEK